MDSIVNEKVFMKWVVPKGVYNSNGEEIQSAREPASEPLPNTPQKAKSVTPRLPSLSDCRSRTATPARPLGSPRRSLHSQATKRGSPVVPLAPAPNVVVGPRTQELLKNANPSERRIIEKAFLLSDHSATSDSLRRTLQPDAEVRVRKWLENATPEERDIALTFFHKLAGNKELMMGENEQRNKIFKVLQALENGRPDTSLYQSHPHFTLGDGKPNLRHIRLLTPNTRRNRWMHTTWHHMPPYPDSDPCNNRSSHYLEAQKLTPRHFVIHPDWGQ